MERSIFTFLVSSLALGAAQAGILIDDFSTGFSSLADNLTTPTAGTHQTGLSVFGGSRTHFLSQLSSTSGAGDSLSTVSNGFSGQEAPGTRSSTNLLYGTAGLGGSPGTYLLTTRNWDFSQNRVFRLAVNTSSAGTIFNVVLTDSVSGIPRTVTRARTVSTAISATEDLYFDFGPTTGSFLGSYASIDLVELRVGTSAGGAYEVASFEAVPEPATLIAIGALAAVGAKRRRVTN